MDSLLLLFYSKVLAICVRLVRVCDLNTYNLQGPKAGHLLCNNCVSEHYQYTNTLGKSRFGMEEFLIVTHAWSAFLFQPNMGREIIIFCFEGESKWLG